MSSSSPAKVEVKVLMRETPTPSGPKRCSVTGTSYGTMLRGQLIRALQERHCLETTIFMQDGAPPHIAKPVKKLLHDTFGEDRAVPDYSLDGVFNYLRAPRFLGPTTACSIFR
ncbi:uncharacterized protein TNCV_4588561 [Trichonephila clavipes]|nr:uncharacterized protein TNCV_4588561 [Trichonephila clavipes]